MSDHCPTPRALGPAAPQREKGKGTRVSWSWLVRRSLGVGCLSALEGWQKPREGRDLFHSSSSNFGAVTRVQSDVSAWRCQECVSRSVECASDGDHDVQVPLASKPAPRRETSGPAMSAFQTEG